MPTGANLDTKKVTLAAINTWYEVGSPAQRDNLLDMFNETGVEVRLHISGNTVAGGDTVVSVPFAADGNYYLDFKLGSNVYVQITDAGGVGLDVTYVEG